MPTFNWDSIQQVLRILAYSVGGWLFGEGVVDESVFQAAVGGLLSVGAFVWWWLWERERTS